MMRPWGVAIDGRFRRHRYPGPDTSDRMKEESEDQDECA